MTDAPNNPKPRRKLRSLLLLLATPPAVLGVAVTYTVFSPNVYEFPSCEQGSKAINVMRVPYGYQSSAKSILIRDDQPIGWLEKDPKDPKDSLGFYRNGGLDSTIMYSTYPEYQPLGLKSWRKYSAMEYESRDPDKLLFATMWFVRGRGVDLNDTLLNHDLNGVPKSRMQRIREDAVGGQYWAYAPHNQRISKSTGEPTYFIPKDTGLHVLITCKDVGINAIPKDGQCFIRSDFGDDPHLGCRSVVYRIAAKDMPNWREFDARVKQQIKSLISQRTHGYKEPLNRKEK